MPAHPAWRRNVQRSLRRPSATWPEASCRSNPGVFSQSLAEEGRLAPRVLHKDRAAHQISPALGSTSSNSLFSHTKELRFLQQLSTKADSTPQPTIPHKFSITSI